MDRGLLKKYFDGECSTEESREVLRYIVSGKAEEELAEEITSELLAFENGEEEWGKEELFETIEGKLNSPYQTKTRRFWPGLMVAASLLLICGFIYLFLYNDLINSQSERKEELTYLIKETQAGQKRKVRLSDGSIVKLNTDSKIWFQSNFSEQSERIVYLEGEAYFDVERNENKPFIVKSGSVSTKVLGTTFCVRAIPDQNNITISLLSGEVEVNGIGEGKMPVKLFPSEQLTVEKLTGYVSKSHLVYLDDIAWKDGILVFDKASIDTIIKKLEPWYGVKIIVQKENIKGGFTGTYKNKSLENTLEGMAFVLDFEFEINGEVVIIK